MATEKRTVAWNHAAIKKLKGEEARYIAWSKSEDGLGVRVSPPGRKTVIWAYRFEGVTRMWTLGTFEKSGDLADLSAKQAKGKLQLGKGVDPGALKIQTRRADKDAITFEELVDEYLRVKLSDPDANAKTWKEAERVLRKYLLSVRVNKKTLGRRKVKELTGDQISRAIASIVDSPEQKRRSRGGLVQANRALAWAKSCLTYAVGQRYIPHNPCDGVAKLLTKEKPKKRPLTDEEVRVFWDTKALPRREHLALKLALLTAVRPGNAAAARWDEFKGAWWTIPEEKFKTGREHRVPLTRTALNILGEARKAFKGKEYVFPAPGADGHLRGDKLPHAVEDAGEALYGDATRWTPKDLRSTVRTNLSRLKVLHETRKHVLGHAVDRMDETYDAHDFDDPKREALLLWEDKLLNRILKGKPLVPDKEAPQGELVTFPAAGGAA